MRLLRRYASTCDPAKALAPVRPATTNSPSRGANGSPKSFHSPSQVPALGMAPRSP